jgi:hypothetical protein
MGQTMACLGHRGKARSRQGESNEVGGVGSKLIFGCVVSLIASLTWRSCGAVLRCSLCGGAQTGASCSCLVRCGVSCCRRYRYMHCWMDTLAFARWRAASATPVHCKPEARVRPGRRFHFWRPSTCRAPSPMANSVVEGAPYTIQEKQALG